MLIRFACFIFLLTIRTVSISQQNVGIRFEKGLSWTAIQQKAKIENKFIFVDAYTTWCIPCRKMASTIFPQQAVGDFFNKSFINIAVQMNKTEKDNKDVKLWYHSAQTIADVYKIQAYPTYLFFDSNGILVHVVEGSSNDANDFIAKAKKLLTPTHNTWL